MLSPKTISPIIINLSLIKLFLHTPEITPSFEPTLYSFSLTSTIDFYINYFSICSLFRILSYLKAIFSNVKSHPSQSNNLTQSIQFNIQFLKPFPYSQSTLPGPRHTNPRCSYSSASWVQCYGLRKIL